MPSELNLADSIVELLKPFDDEEKMRILASCSIMLGHYEKAEKIMNEIWRRGFKGDDDAQ